MNSVFQVEKSAQSIAGSYLDLSNGPSVVCGPLSFFCNGQLTNDN